MKNKIYRTFDEAVADIPNGSVFMSPGFGGVGIPRNILAAVNRQGAKGLTGISNNAGTVDAKVDVGTLIAAGQVKKMCCAFTATPHPSQVTAFVRMYNNGEVDAELIPQGTLAEGKEHREIDGKVYVLEYPLHADYAFIRAWKADTFGNLQFRLTQRNFNPIMAMAARVTIVEVENDIVPMGELDPDQIHVPGVYVDRLVRIPPDGIWD